MSILLTGFFVVDIVFYNIDRVPEPGEIVRTEDIYISTGGHPLNIAISLVKLGLDPRAIHVCGVLCKDLFSRFIIETVSSYGINMLLKTLDKCAAAITIAISEKGKDRRFLHFVGSNKLLDFQHVVECLSRVNPKYFFVAMGALDSFDMDSYKAIDRANSMDAVTLLDISPKHEEERLKYIAKAMMYSDIVHCNIAEFKTVFRGFSIEEAVSKLFREGKTKLVFITKGENGVELYTQSGLKIEQRAYPVEVVDTTGAGDAFDAGVLFKLFENSIGKSELENIDVDMLVEITAFAQAVAAACITMPGATTGITRENVRRIIEMYGDRIKRSTAIQRLAI